MGYHQKFYSFGTKPYVYNWTGSAMQPSMTHNQGLGDTRYGVRGRHPNALSKAQPIEVPARRGSLGDVRGQHPNALAKAHAIAVPLHRGSLGGVRGQLPNALAKVHAIAVPGRRGSLGDTKLAATDPRLLMQAKIKDSGTTTSTDPNFTAIVLGAQQRLNRLGAALPEDGLLSTKMTAAMQTYVDVNTATWAQLYAVLDAKIAALPSGGLLHNPLFYLGAAALGYWLLKK